MKLKANRLEALVDGIFAIIMTIMIVSLSEVFILPNSIKNADFYKLFLTLFDDFLVYAVSFLILGVLWLEHHWQFHFIKHIDPMLVFINIIWLMFLCLIPFSAMLLGNYLNFFVVMLIFELNILITFLVLYIHWAYAMHKDRLIDTFDKRTLLKHRKFYLFPVIVALFTIALTVLINVLKN